MLFLAIASILIGIGALVYAHWGHPASHNRKRINSLEDLKKAVLKTMKCARSKYTQLTISPALFQAATHGDWFLAYQNALRNIPTQTGCHAELVFINETFLRDSVFRVWAVDDAKKPASFNAELDAILDLTGSDAFTCKELEPLRQDHPEQPLPFLIAVADGNSRKKMAIICAFDFCGSIQDSTYLGFWTDNPQCVETIHNIMQAYVAAMEKKGAVSTLS